MKNVFELLIGLAVVGTIVWGLYVSGAVAVMFPSLKTVPPKIELFTHPIPGGNCLIAKTVDGQVAVACVEVK